MIVWPDATDPLGDAGIEALGVEIRRRLGPVAEPPSLPTVSIVVVNRDGLEHLRRLLRGLAERTDYPDLELVLVDNGSTDGSLDFIRDVAAPFPVAIVANLHNESFADACNQGAAAAGGELLLFLNNDVEPVEPGWLRELVACRLAHGAGLAGATLVFPKAGSSHGYLVQHRAMRLLDNPVFPGADGNGHGEEPFGEGFGEDAETVFPSGACMLIERDLLWQVGGFTHGYVYGGEDIDLAWKLRDRSRAVLCSGRSVLIHRFSSTRDSGDPDEKRAMRAGNRRLLWERWGPRVRREYELDRLAGGGVWAAPGQPWADGRAPRREELLALSFCLKSTEPSEEGPAGDRLERAHEGLEGLGHRCAVLRQGSVEHLSGFNYDVAVHLRGPARYLPGRVQLNVLWVTAEAGEVPVGELDRYQLLVAEDPAVLDRLRRTGGAAPVVALAPDPAAALAAAAAERARRLGFETRIPAAAGTTARGES